MCVYVCVFVAIACPAKCFPGISGSKISVSRSGYSWFTRARHYSEYINISNKTFCSDVIVYCGPTVAVNTCGLQKLSRVSIFDVAVTSNTKPQPAERHCVIHE